MMYNEKGMFFTYALEFPEMTSDDAQIKDAVRVCSLRDLPHVKLFKNQV